MQKNIENNNSNVRSKGNNNYFASKTFSIALIKQYTTDSTIINLEKYLETGELNENLSFELTLAMVKWANNHCATHFIPFFPDFFTNFFSNSNGFVPIKIKQNHFNDFEDFNDLKDFDELEKFEIFINLHKGFQILSNVKISGSIFLCNGIKDLRSAPFIIKKILYIPIILEKKIDKISGFYAPIINIETIFTNSLKKFLELIKTNTTNLRVKYSWTQEICLIPEHIFSKIKDLISFEEIKSVLRLDSFDFNFFQHFLNVLKSEIFYLGLEILEIENNKKQFTLKFKIKSQSIINSCISQLKFNELISVVAKEFGLVVFNGNCPWISNQKLEKNISLSIFTNENILSFKKEPMQKLRVLILLVCAIKVFSEKNDFFKLFLGEVYNNFDFNKNYTTLCEFKVFLGDLITNVFEVILKITNIGSKVKNGLEYSKIIEKIDLTEHLKVSKRLNSAFIYSGNSFIFKINQFTQNPCIFITFFLCSFNDELSEFIKLYEEKNTQKNFNEFATIFDILKVSLEKCSNIILEGSCYYSSYLNNPKNMNYNQSSIINCIISINDSELLKICSEKLDIHPKSMYNWYKNEIELIIYNLNNDFKSLNIFIPKYLKHSLKIFTNKFFSCDSINHQILKEIFESLDERAIDIKNKLELLKDGCLEIKSCPKMLVKAVFLSNSFIKVGKILKELKEFEFMISGNEYTMKELYECIKLCK